MSSMRQEDLLYLSSSNIPFMSHYLLICRSTTSTYCKSFNLFSMFLTFGILVSHFLLHLSLNCFPTWWDRKMLLRLSSWIFFNNLVHNTITLQILYVLFQRRSVWFNWRFCRILSKIGDLSVSNTLVNHLIIESLTIIIIWRIVIFKYIRLIRIKL